MDGEQKRERRFVEFDIKAATAEDFFSALSWLGFYSDGREDKDGLFILRSAGYVTDYHGDLPYTASFGYGFIPWTEAEKRGEVDET